MPEMTAEETRQAEVRRAEAVRAEAARADAVRARESDPILWDNPPPQEGEPARDPRRDPKRVMIGLLNAARKRAQDPRGSCAACETESHDAATGVHVCECACHDARALLGIDEPGTRRAPETLENRRARIAAEREATAEAARVRDAEAHPAPLEIPPVGPGEPLPADLGPAPLAAGGEPEPAKRARK